jgi:predicted secreted protein
VPALRKARPITLKQQLVGRAPDHARAAVWSLGGADDGRHLLVDTGDEIHVRLEEIRSTGYRWTPTSATLEGFTVIGDSLEPPDASETRRYGVPQSRHLVFKAINAGSHSIVVDLLQAWDEDAGATRRFGVAVDIEAPRISEVGKGVSVNQQPQLVAA